MALTQVHHGNRPRLCEDGEALSSVHSTALLAAGKLIHNLNLPICSAMAEELKRKACPSAKLHCKTWRSSKSTCRTSLPGINHLPMVPIYLRFIGWWRAGYVLASCSNEAAAGRTVEGENKEADGKGGCNAGRRS